MKSERVASQGTLECAVGAAVAFGLLEWLARGIARPDVMSLQDAAVALSAVVVVYGGFGLAGAAVALALREGIAPEAAGPAAAAAALTLGLTIAESGLHPLWTPAGAALGFVVYRVVSWLLLSIGPLRSMLRWSAIAMAALAAAVAHLALTFRGAGLWALGVALVAAVVAVVLVVTHRSTGRWRLLRPLLAVVPVVGLAGLAFQPRPLPPASASAAGRPNVVLITIDTLRADHVGAYGHAAARTPNLDRLAANGVRFEQAIAPAGITGPSHGTILTGKLPDETGMITNNRRIPPEIDTVAESFRQAGYATGAFVSGWTTTDETTGLPSRFSYYDEDFRSFRLLPDRSFRMILLRDVRRALLARGEHLAPVRRNAAAVTERALAWLDRLDGRPFFMWIHYFDPHLPYERVPDRLLDERARGYRGPVDGRWYSIPARRRNELVHSPADVEQMFALYDAEIAFVDEQVGRLLERAQAVAGGTEPIVLATADHGESMGEHHLWWKRNNYDPTLRVPLIVRDPGQAPGRAGTVVTAQVRLLDVAPTLVDLAGVSPLQGVSGTSLRPLIEARETESTGPAWSVHYIEATDFKRPVFSLRYDGWKLIRRPAGWRGIWMEEGVEELYRLDVDPGERNDLAHREPGVPAELDALFHRYSRDVARGQRLERTLDPAAEERLRSLGYVQ